MTENKTSNDNFSKPDPIPDNDTGREDVSISEMAEMIGIYYNEIKSVATDLERADSPLPKSDVINLLNSLCEYAKVGSELAATFHERVETFATVKSAELNDL